MLRHNSPYSSVMEEEYKQIKIHFFLNEMKSGAVRKKKSDIKKSIYFYMV